ncbi:unnamed protein product [Gongylonema pulchrum]|uniref:Transposase n=1 Tax=Gongylonema pulchrum TaxID=637853 RepID=A0A183EF39_9BILA|nr:unnamed protein product [Gongylonema pulchrum]
MFYIDPLRFQVLESGSHFELLKKPHSRYAELWRSQHKYAGGVPPKVSKPKHDELLLELLDNRLDDGCCRSGGGACKR